MGFVRRNSAFFRMHSQDGSIEKDAGAAPASFEPPCGCVRRKAELRPTKPAASSAISPHVRLPVFFFRVGLRKNRRNTYFATYDLRNPAGNARWVSYGVTRLFFGRTHKVAQKMRAQRPHLLSYFSSPSEQHSNCAPHFRLTSNPKT